MSLVLLAVGFAIVAPTAALVYAVRAGIAAWRDLRHTMNALAGETGALAQRLEKLAAFEPPDLERASSSFERLQRDRAQLSILLGALGRAREQFSAFAIVYPKK